MGSRKGSGNWDAASSGTDKLTAYQFPSAALIPLYCPEPVPATGRLMIVWGFRGAVSPGRCSTDQTTI
jgi:hypothetical protein